MSRKAPTPPPYKPGDTVCRPAPPPPPPGPQGREYRGGRRVNRPPNIPDTPTQAAHREEWRHKGYIPEPPAMPVPPRTMTVADHGDRKPRARHTALDRGAVVCAYIGGLYVLCRGVWWLLLWGIGH